jgi:hypothetical protein
MTLVLDARARLGDAANQSTEATLRQSGVIPIRAAGRYISTSIRFAAGTNWDYIQGLEIDAQQAGER